ncbi:MAG: hypothetical protein NTZ49_02540 [Candidatus Parcubacteria bacterium]|nr:hypothetical protein [Candidatus Parcubacteria bacterium]
MEKQRLFIIIALVLALGLLAGCNSASNSQSVKEKAYSAIVDHGSGVYYFPYQSSSFAKALAAFIKDYPELEPVIISGDATGCYGRDIGYFVIFRQKK